MHARGFTLIEVVIAMFIAAIMFAIGYGAINQALRDRDALNVSQERVTEIQRGMRVVAQDFAQVVARGARDTSGSGELMPAMVANGSSDSILTFTRSGWSNPAGIQRPAEQRVRYRFIEGALVREHWLSVDPALNAEPLQRTLLTRITAVEVRFLDPVSRQWRTEWPATGTTGQVPPASVDQLLTRPIAIEFTVVFEDWGRVQRLFEIPT
ncbi:MAG TPA: type II secretion system minor pseudopilin GspJ [Steroidobacteraceae bacterium]|nr:type II secretion system minor pseudopilin GspJ [Steroidobacteraceae bacterium]